MGIATPKGQRPSSLKLTYDSGVEAGRREMKAEILTHLEKKYMAPDAPERTSAKGQAILDLAREIAQEFNAKPQ